MRQLDTMRALELQLGSEDGRQHALGDLRAQWKALAGRANAPQDSGDRRFARRVLSQLAASLTTTDPDYLAIVNEYRLARR
jgi:hypothetical protein